jgi:diguanylate cyclase (GGDEF)-like protein/PAS domain S-box-containing protein
VIYPKEANTSTSGTRTSHAKGQKVENLVSDNNLLGIESITSLLEGIYNSTGIVSSIYNLEGKLIASSGKESLCSKYFSCISECVTQRNMRNNLASNIVNENKTFQYSTCINGLEEVVIPIMVRDTHVANLFSGQFFYKKPDITYYRKRAKELGFDESSFIQAIHEIPVIDKVKVKKIIEFLLSIIHTYCDLTHQRIELIDLNNELCSSTLSLKETENNYQMLFHEMLNGFAYHEIIIDKEGKPIDYEYIDVNPAFEKIIGLERECVVGKRVLEIFPETEQFWIDTYGTVAITGKPIIFENYSKSVDKHFHVTAFQPSINKFCCMFIDISKRVKAELELKRRVKYEQLLSHISLQSISVKDIYEKRQEDINEHMYQWCSKGIPPLEGDVKDIIMYWWDDMLLHNNIVACSDIEEITNPQAKQILQEQGIQSIFLIPLFIDGEYFGCIGFDDSIAFRDWTEADIDILTSISRIIATVTERAFLEEHLQYQYTHDYLTGLYNRRYLECELKRLEPEKYLPLSFIIVDTNGLKLINDSFGYSMGDQVLKKAASVLEKNCGALDFVTRYGGDEFLMILPNISEDEAKERIRMIQLMASKIEIASIQLTLAFGLYTRKNKADEFETCFKHAEDMMYQNKLNQNNSNKYKTIRLALNSLFLKSSRESQHSKRVSKLSEFIASKMNFSSKEVSRIRLAGILHDIGKISIPEHILNKTSTLNEVEWLQMKIHPETGYRILSTSSDFIDISTAILEHHERWDGMGYPRGIKGEDISIQARIISIADSFDAMTQARPYKEPISEEQAIEEILTCAGTQFDPTIARVFVEHYHEYSYNSVDV